MQAIKLVLFDLDGTLVDTAPDLAWCVDASLEKLGMPPCGEAKVRGWIGSGIEGLLHRALTDDINGRAEKDCTTGHMPCSWISILIMSARAAPSTRV